MEAAKEKAQLVNGVNTEQLFNTIDLIKENPDIAKFKFRATNKWINGTHLCNPWCLPNMGINPTGGAFRSDLVYILVKFGSRHYHGHTSPY